MQRFRRYAVCVIVANCILISIIVTWIYFGVDLSSYTKINVFNDSRDMFNGVVATISGSSWDNTRLRVKYSILLPKSGNLWFRHPTAPISVRFWSPSGNPVGDGEVRHIFTQNLNRRRADAFDLSIRVPAGASSISIHGVGVETGRLPIPENAEWSK